MDILGGPPYAVVLSLLAFPLVCLCSIFIRILNFFAHNMGVRLVNTQAKSTTEFLLFFPHTVELGTQPVEFVHSK